MIKPKPGNGHATRVVNANSRTTPEPCLKLHWVYFWECLWVIARNSITPGLHYSICTPGKRYQKGHVSLDWVGSDKKSATANSQLSTHTGRYVVHGSDLKITPKKHFSTPPTASDQTSFHSFSTDGLKALSTLLASRHPTCQKERSKFLLIRFPQCNHCMLMKLNGMTASDHFHRLSKLMHQCGKTDANFLCLVGDKCHFNQCMSRLP